MKQKSILQQLQSRISLRRNYITYMENQHILHKRAGLRGAAKAIRNEIKLLADDQKLDKRLYVLALYDDADRRWHDNVQQQLDAAFDRCYELA